MISWKESYDKCQIGVCKYATFDMDGEYCAHPKSFELTFYGASTNRMIAEGLCVGCCDDPAKNTRELWEPVDV